MKKILLAGGFIIAFLLVFNIQITPRFGFSDSSKSESPSQTEQKKVPASMIETVAPKKGIELSVSWKDFGKQMVDAGVIDKKKFEELYTRRGGLNSEQRSLLTGTENENITINHENAQYLLNLLWAFGLGNKNKILEEGEMVAEEYGGAQNFASTGGWSLASGEAMDHYSKHAFVTLTEKQQNLVEEVSKNIFRPCCGNSTHFPDCNHGMAMLGLLQILASQGADEEEMYEQALTVNSYWFPDTYDTLARYSASNDVAWNTLNAKDILGAEYSSAQGYRNILSKIEPSEGKKSGGCGV